MSTATLHAINMVCHTLILMTVIIAVATLSAQNHLNTETVGFLATIGGVTGGGLIINGRKAPGNDGGPSS